MIRKFLAGGSALVCVALVATIALAAQEHIEGIREECESQLGYAPARCDCIGDQAATQLNDNQQAFMYAQATKNQAEIQRLQGLMTIDEMTETGSFMSGVAGICP